MLKRAETRQVSCAKLEILMYRRANSETRESTEPEEITADKAVPCAGAALAGSPTPLKVTFTPCPRGSVTGRRIRTSAPNLTACRDRTSDSVSSKFHWRCRSMAFLPTENKRALTRLRKKFVSDG